MPRYTIKVVRVREVPGGPRVKKTYHHLALDYPDEKTARRDLEADGTLRVVQFLPDWLDRLRFLRS